MEKQGGLIDASHIFRKRIQQNMQREFVDCVARMSLITTIPAAEEYFQYFSEFLHNSEYVGFFRESRNSIIFQLSAFKKKELMIQPGTDTEHIIQYIDNVIDYLKRL